jgi:hypothetical protein
MLLGHWLLCSQLQHFLLALLLHKQSFGLPSQAPAHSAKMRAASSGAQGIGVSYFMIE